MKNIRLLFLLFLTTLAFSQKNSGSITLSDGTILTGLVKVNSKSFQFKKDENSKSVKYDYNQATSATVLNKKNATVKYEFVYVDYKKKPLLLTVINDGFLKLYGEFTSSTNYASSAPGSGMNGGFGVRASSTYHIKRTTDKFGQYYVAYGYIPKIGFEKVIKKYFTDCPEIQSKVESKEFKKNDFKEIVDFYNDNCAPKN